VNYAAARAEGKFEVSEACHHESEGIARTLKAAITIRNGWGSY
jgi:hypothetical protein